MTELELLQEISYKLNFLTNVTYSIWNILAASIILTATILIIWFLILKPIWRMIF